MKVVVDPCFGPVFNTRLTPYFVSNIWDFAHKGVAYERVAGGGVYRDTQSYFFCMLRAAVQFGFVSLVACS